MEKLLITLDWTAYLTGIVGAPLSWIEYFHPKTADRIEEIIDITEHRFEAYGNKFTRSRFYEVLFTVAVPITILLLAAIVDSQQPKALQNIKISGSMWMLMMMIVFPVYLGIFFYIVTGTIKYLNRMTNGHALGAFGIILIIIGLIGDSLDKLLS